MQKPARSKGIFGIKTMNDYGIRVDDDGFEVFEENEFPLAYLITIRTYGTWLHGDKRKSVQRDGSNIYGTPRIEPNGDLESEMRGEMAGPQMLLDRPMREVVETAFKDLCIKRAYLLHAMNARSNHAHAVISAQMTPERIADSLKANATKMLRAAGLVAGDVRVWSRGRSRRYLWKPRNVLAAIDYTLYSQSDEDFAIDDADVGQ